MLLAFVSDVTIFIL